LPPWQIAPVTPIPGEQAAPEAAPFGSGRHRQSSRFGACSGHLVYFPSAVKIYTRTGDAGETSLFDGSRVSKADSRVDAYGDVDELNAWLGLVRASRIDADLDEPLVRIQQDLFALGAQLADPRDRIAERVRKASLGDADVERLEHLIDRLESELPPLRRFILAGGSPAGAALHVARTVCRRAERRMVALTPVPDAVLIKYVNRLSDFLFVIARVVNHRAGVPEVEW
jgi:cob(I)alamin adenosyltransferase